MGYTSLAVQNRVFQEGQAARMGFSSEFIPLSCRLGLSTPMELSFELVPDTDWLEIGTTGKLCEDLIALTLHTQGNKSSSQRFARGKHRLLLPVAQCDVLHRLWFVQAPSESRLPSIAGLEEMRVLFRETTGLARHIPRLVVWGDGRLAKVEWFGNQLKEEAATGLTVH
jgi:hypothetical protein